MAEEAVIQQSLAGLTRTMGTHMDRIAKSNVTFREAAAQHNKNISNIVKDVFVAISGQRKEMSHTSDALEEFGSSVQQGFRENSRAVNALQDSMQGVLDVQYKVLSELSTSNRLLSFIANNTNNNILSNIFGTALSSTFGQGWFEKLGNVLKTILPMAAGAGAGYMAGQSLSGGGQAGQISNPVMANDIYNYLTKDKGVDHNHAVGMLANIQSESKFNSGAFNRNDVNGPSGGLFQHHDNYRTGEHRFSDMTKAAGPDWQKNWKGQIDFALSERDMQSYLKRPVNSGEDAARAFVYDFERPRDKEGEASRRAGNVAAVEKAIKSPGKTESSTGSAAGAVTPTTPAGSTTNFNTTNISNPSAPDPGRQAPAGVPSVTGPAGELKTKGGVDTEHLQSDIVSKFKTIQSQAGMGLTVTSGFRDPQHNAAVGGAKNSAHTRGNAVDVTFPGGVDETNKLIETASKAGIGGIGVYRPGVLHFDTESKRAWGPDYHSSSIPQWALPAINAHLGGKTPASGTAVGGEGITPSMAGGATPAAPAAATGGETGGQPVDPRLASGKASDIMSYAREQFIATSGITPIMGGGIPGMGMGMGIPGVSMGGLGGLAGALMPLLASAAGELIQNDQQGALQSSPEIAQHLVPQMETGKQLQAAALQEKVAQTVASYQPEKEQRETDLAQLVQTPDRHMPQGSYSDYNMDNHLYPDWASMVFGRYGDFTGPNGGNVKTSF